MKKVLFICTQNVFRSYSAHLILENYLKNNNIKDVEVDSAGTLAYDFEEPYAWTLNKLNNLGISTSKHKNKKVTKELTDDSIIICMTKEHKEYIKNKFQKESFLFNELAINQSTDLEDDVETNFQTTLQEFVEQTINKIHKGIPKIANFIENT